jgi:hypothetical protein
MWVPPLLPIFLVDYNFLGPNLAVICGIFSIPHSWSVLNQTDVCEQFILYLLYKLENIEIGIFLPVKIINVV